MPNPNGAVAGNAQNLPEAHVPRSRSTFPLHAHLFNTHRFGEYIPHYVDDLTKDDRYPVHSSSQVRTYTLKSPLMQNVTRNKDYFLVPMEAILPLNWEKFFDNPVLGDEAPQDCGPTVVDFWQKVATLFNAFESALSTLFADASTSVSVGLQAFFRFLIFGEYFYSDGNLLASLICHGSSYVHVANGNADAITWDDYFDFVVSNTIKVVSDANQNFLFNLSVDGVTYYVVIDVGKPGSYNISVRHALQLMRDNPTFVISNPSSAFDGPNGPHALNGIFDYFSNWLLLTRSYISAEVPCNLSRLWAYQLSVAHYMTNDHIDFVYSAELYRQLVGNYHIMRNAGSLPASMFFTRNGIRYQYDYLSAKSVSIFLAGAVTASSSILTATSGSVLAYHGFFSALFGYRRSLRYLDYFTGSRSNPLAVVNTGGYVSTGNGVTSPSLSVLDITKSIQAQRFLNSVNRVRHSFEGYLKGIFGGKLPAPDYHNPFYLAHCSDTIFGQETENTSGAQLQPKNSTEEALPIAVTTNLRGSGKYMFEFDTDRPAVVIGITSYDIARIYQHATDRSYFHKDRFDWFNPFMQYIGDQSVYLQELGISPTTSALATMKNFSYQLRHAEYKQKFNTAAGGFCIPSTDLDNWIFAAMDIRGNQLNISPDWIRSVSAEFDRFYVSLTGYSLGTYFHFIVDDFNSVNASRPMAYSPQILG